MAPLQFFNKWLSVHIVPYSFWSGSLASCISINVVLPKILKNNPFTSDKITSNLTNNSSVPFQTKLLVFHYLRNNWHSEIRLKEIVHWTYMPRSKGPCIKAALYLFLLTCSCFKQQQSICLLLKNMIDNPWPC